MGTYSVNTPELEKKAAYLRDLNPEHFDSDLKFCKDIASKYFTYGGSSPSQAKWIGIKYDKYSPEKIAAKLVNPTPTPAQSGAYTQSWPVIIPKTSVVQFSKIVAMFQKAAETLKSPKLKLKADGKTLKLRMASNGLHAGAINVTDGKPYGQNKWYGRILKSGHFQAAGSLSTEDYDFVLKALCSYENDPAGVSKAYGQAYNHCCYCGATLTDPSSVAAGYGPICAENYGLPWGHHHKEGGVAKEANITATVDATEAAKIKELAQKIANGSLYKDVKKKIAEELKAMSPPPMKSIVVPNLSPEIIAELEKAHPATVELVEPVEKKRKPLF